MTIREYAEQVVSIGVGFQAAGHPVGDKLVSLGRGILVELGNSRETTDKETVMTVDRDQPDNTPTSIKVVNHKARVVWDD